MELSYSVGLDSNAAHIKSTWWFIPFLQYKFLFFWSLAEQDKY